LRRRSRDEGEVPCAEALAQAKAIEDDVSALVALIRASYQAGQQSHP